MDFREAITLGLAIYGAVLGTLGAAWSAVALFRDRGKLELSIFVGKDEPRSSPHQKEDIDYVVFTVTNIGRRQVVLYGIQALVERHLFKVKTMALLVQPEMHNRSLAEGEKVTEALPLTVELRDSLLSYKKMMVTDSVGRDYSISRKQLRFLKKHLREANTCSLVRDVFGGQLWVLDKLRNKIE